MTTGTSSVSAVSPATRTFLILGVIAGPFFFAVGIMLALSRPGFDITRHQLSLLMLGEDGWLQAANLILTGVMVVLASIGLSARMRATGRGSAPAVLTAVFGLGCVGSGIFPPDPMLDFPPGVEPAGSMSGVLHLVFGMAQFVALAVAAFVAARGDAKRGARPWSVYGIVTGVAILLGFVGGAVFSQILLGLMLLWLTVATCFAWIAAQCVRFTRSAV